jgi:hypothetical protein
MCVNAQGICQRLGEPKSKTNIYCMKLKRCLERTSKESVQNRDRMQEMRNMSAQIFMQYIIGARK